MDRIGGMRAFTRVVEHGSFARAAEDLGISPASVTTQIARLEKHLGVRLLHRSTRRLSLTDEGRGYYQSCVRVLEQLDEAEEALRGSRAAVRGLLRVSVPQVFTRRLLFPALLDFLRQHPELSLELVITDRAVNLVEEGIDCAVRAVAIAPDSALVFRPIASGKLLTCAAPEFLRANGTPARVADLAGLTCVPFISPSTGRVQDWSFEHAGVRESFTPHGRLAVTALEGVAAAAIAGLGIAQVPSVLVHEEITSGRLQPVLLERVAPTPVLGIAFPGNRYLSARVRAFADFIAALYPQQGWWPEILAAVAPQDAAAREN
jgi:DNA-binding transcriptional LysR family regulator